MTEEYKFKLSKKQTIAIDILQDSETEELLFGGAAGSGKSILGCVWQIENRLKHKGSRGLIMRKSLKDLMSITIPTTFALCAKMLGSGSNWRYTINEQKGVIQFSNGSMIYLRDGAYNPSDPYYDRLKVEVTDAWIEEGTQVPEAAYKMIKSRIRYMLEEINLPPKLLITSNPGETWVKYQFIKDAKGREISLPVEKKFVQAFVHDNPDEVFVKRYSRTLEQLDPKLVAMYLHGLWDVNLNDNPFFYAFTQSHQVSGGYEIDRAKPIEISFDFNIDPCTAVISQKVGNTINIFDNILENQKSYAGLSSLQAVCKTIKRKYFDSGIIKPYYVKITGDSSGRSGSADRQTSNTFFNTICTELGVSEAQLFVRKMNLTHIASGQMCNEVLKLHDIKFWDCAELVSDINRAYSDSEGSLNQAKKEYGLHLVDAFRYLIDLYFGYNYSLNSFNKDIKLILDNIKYAKFT